MDDVVDDHVHGSGCIGHAAVNVYDGVLVWQCSDGQLRNVWRRAIEENPGNQIIQDRYRAAEMIIDAIMAGAMRLPTVAPMGPS